MERHIEEKDCIIDQLVDELKQSRMEVSALQNRAEDAEINSRLPCVILSGPAMAPRHAPRLEPPLPAQSAPGAPGRSASAAAADPSRGHPMTSRPADLRAREVDGGPSQSRAGAGGDRRGPRGRAEADDGWEREDINALVVNTLNECMPGLNITDRDIDRAHRLPGPNNRVIVRFVRSGQGSVREEVMARRLELRGRNLFINESLTKLRGQIFRSLLAAKREKKIYTVFTRGGNVFFKEKQHGVSTRVDSLQGLRDRGYAVLDR